MSRVRVALAVAAVAVLTVRAGDHTAGRRIYAAGEGTSAIAASVGGAGELPASMLPCANCHGADGRGNAEGGVVASNITWLELTKPYRAATPNGRRRPPYTEASLRRAIAEGVDSAGNPLHAAMPRYAMSPADLDALVAYLKVLGREEVPGVTASSVRVATIVPASDAGTQMAAVLRAYFQDAGEIHGRRVTLDVVSPAQLGGALQNDPPFALVGGLIAGAETVVEEAVERAGVPLVLPVSLRSDASARNRQRFYLHPGLEAQLRGFLKFRAPSRLLVIARDEELIAMARRAAAPLEISVAPTVPAQLDADTTVLFLDPDAKLADVPPGDSPLLFLGSLLPSDFFNVGRASARPPDADGRAEARPTSARIHVALTTTPADLGGLAEYRAFAARHSIPPTQIASQLSAYAAAKVLVHALQRSGRELTRDALRGALESLYEFETGVTPPLTFGRGRRIAAPRVHVATMDAGGNLAPAGTFHAVD